MGAGDPRQSAQGVVARVARCRSVSLRASGGRGRGADVCCGATNCPRHAARFSLRTGAALSPPACRPLATYPVRVVAGQIEIALARTSQTAR